MLIQSRPRSRYCLYTWSPRVCTQSSGLATSNQIRALVGALPPDPTSPPDSDCFRATATSTHAHMDVSYVYIYLYVYNYNCTHIHIYIYINRRMYVRIYTDSLSRAYTEASLKKLHGPGIYIAAMAAALPGLEEWLEAAPGMSGAFSSKLYLEVQGSYN